MAKINIYTKNMGKSFFIISSLNGINRIKPIIEESFSNEEIALTFEVFNGECSKNEIEKLRNMDRSKGCDVIIDAGIGDALAKLCYNTLKEDALKAKLAVEKKVCTDAVENIVEANTYLSGVGFESGGVAGAHSIHNGFTELEQCHHLYHGEKVTFVTIAQLVLENSPMEEIEEVIELCVSVGLPVTLEEMGITEIKEDELRKVAKASCVECEAIHNMPFEVTEDNVYAAILAADALGKIYKS